ncbi:MAG TPA: hypothetical protein VFI37_08295 [Gaiellaceae bacterium]|jgi:hypothetical protein|nr:hypothetical protein [Gaiellaceae bacterium]
MSEQPPVSWLLIEPGWKVESADGEELGRVEEVAGDSSTDIWDGLSIATGPVARPRYVAAEQVEAIYPERIVLSLDKAGFEALGEWKEPPTSAEIEPEKASLLERAERPVEAPIRDDAERPPLLRRILLWLGLGRD